MLEAMRSARSRRAALPIAAAWPPSSRRPAIGGTRLSVQVPGALGRVTNIWLADKLLATIRGLPDEVRSVLLVAHNPGVQALVLLLAGTSGGRVARRTARDFPPGALARLAFDSKNWNRLAPGTTSLRDFFTPRDSLPFPPARIFK